jgi:hypothetical protein
MSDLFSQTNYSLWLGEEPDRRDLTRPTGRLDGVVADLKPGSNFDTSTRACARVRYGGLTPAELFPPPALSCRYPRTPRLRPRASRAAAMKLASVVGQFSRPQAYRRELNSL